MNIIIAIQTKWFQGTNQVVYQTNQVVRTTPKRPSENTGQTLAFVSQRERCEIERRK